MTKFDELNRLAIPYETFFGEMNLSRDEILRRIELAELLDDVFIFVFTLVKSDIRAGIDVNKAEYVEKLNRRLFDSIEEYGLKMSKYTTLKDYIPKVSDDIISSTIRNKSDDYFFSKERAKIVSENETNSIYNTVNFTDAKIAGKKWKTWVTEGDTRVRPWHVDVDYKKIPIDDWFYVGTDRMLYPHDYINGSASNLVFCRCVCQYT